MIRLVRRLRRDRDDRERDNAAFREEMRAQRRAAEREVARLRRLPLPSYDGGFFDTTLFGDFPVDPRPPGGREEEP